VWALSPPEAPVALAVEQLSPALSAAEQQLLQASPAAEQQPLPVGAPEA
jgi:hypothetical protein